MHSLQNAAGNCPIFLWCSGCIFLCTSEHFRLKTILPLILGDFSDIRASPTCLLTPVLVPPVKIQAPVVLAAFKRPLRSDLLIRGCSSKLAFPPVVVISNLGLSRHHSRNKRLRTSSGFVSYANRMYWALFV